ncbi:MAG TPA: YicC family protein [Candidatus Hydrogenedentes bacterium]|nr:YicC family protein [Candidatus Hydrogenedentota bacterium]HQH51119.1 YicC family protein [Candidatus Hydrogenedentota bacterium]
MVRSMTGFGKVACTCQDQEISLELSSVNHRYLDCSFRLGNSWVSLEPVFKGVVRKHVSRGKVQVTVNRRKITTSAETVRLDTGLARQYMDALRELAAMMGSDRSMSLDTLARMDGVLYQEEPGEDLEEVERVLTSAIEEALERLNVMRTAEGAILAEDIRHRIHLMRRSLSEIEARLPELNAKHEERLRARIQELASDVSITEERIAIEVALLADKGDVTEETVRLKTHLAHMEELLGSDEPVGRRLDFLSQEIQREVNTLGVKTRDCEVAKYVLDMKSELEKIREQVQNVE